jgi:hypothetical protein
LLVEPADALDRGREILARHRHAMAVGVQNGFRIFEDGDMTLPEYQVATADFGSVDRLAEACRLHVGIARRSSARHQHRQLDEAGAIDAEAGTAAPEIGRLQETGDDLHVIGAIERADRLDVLGEDRASVLEHDIAIAARFRLTGDMNATSHRQDRLVGLAQFRFGIDEGALHGDDMGRRRPAFRERIRRDITDITVRGGFHPAPATGAIENRHVLAEKHFGIDAAGKVRFGTQGHDRDGDAGRGAFRKTQRLDLAFEPRFREIRPVGMQAAVEHRHSHSFQIGNRRA